MPAKTDVTPASLRRLPQRYAEPWRAAFQSRAAQVLVDGARVLDVGSGRSPAIPPPLRPARCRYVGLDISPEELARAAAGSYDETIVGDLLAPQPELSESFDVALSWQVLEHVRPLATALETIRGYLRPGGHLVAQLTGRWAIFAIVNRLLPHRLGSAVMRSALAREPGTVFPAHYDAATETALSRALANWSAVEIVPRYRGATYLSPVRPAQKLYLRYEGWAAAKHRDLATHYLVFAKK